jgi:hypothetical protein
MTGALATAIHLDGVGACRDAARVLQWLRRQGSDGATRGHIARAIRIGGEHVRSALAALLDARLVEVVPATGWPQRWRVPICENAHEMKRATEIDGRKAERLNRVTGGQ